MLQAPQPDKMPGPLVPKAATGHFDELRGGATDGLSAHWSAFFDHPGAAEPQELNLRSASLERQVRDNGVTYNVYADAGGPQRPWSLDLFPLLFEPEQWLRIEAGVLQRMQLLAAATPEFMNFSHFVLESCLVRPPPLCCLL